MSYTVLLSNQAEKCYKKLRKNFRARVREALISLGNKPRAGKPLHVNTDVSKHSFTLSLVISPQTPFLSVSGIVLEHVFVTYTRLEPVAYGYYFSPTPLPLPFFSWAVQGLMRRVHTDVVVTFFRDASDA